MADPGCRTCFDTGVIFDRNDLAIPCPVCDAWMEPETSVIDRQKRNKNKKKKKKAPQPKKKVDIDITDIADDDDLASWGAWWDDDDFDWGGDHFWEDDDPSPLRLLPERGKGKKKRRGIPQQERIPWWEDPTDPFGPKGDERSQRGRNPRPIQDQNRSRGMYFTKPAPKAHEYVKDVPEREKPEGDWFEYDTRWFNEDLNSHVLHTIRTLTEAYPVTKKWFRGIRVSDVPPTACVVPNDRKIWLTPSFLDKPGTNGFKRNNHKKGLDRLIAHEFGHALHASILADSVGEEALPDLDMNDLLGRNYSGDSLSHPDSPATYIMEDGKKKVSDTYITGYGETDELERFAEAMTEHWTRARPPELADFVGRHIDFLYHKDGRLNKSLDDQSWWESTIEKKDSDEGYKQMWSDVTGQDYKDWWVDTKRKQQTEKAEKAEYARWWEKQGAVTTPEFIGDAKTPKDLTQQQYIKWWNREMGQQYINWWQVATGNEYEDWWRLQGSKRASIRPDVLYHIAPMSRRHDFLSNGIEPTVVLANEVDAQQVAQKRSAKEPQDIWYIDPTGLDIVRGSVGWKVRSSISPEHIMQVEGFEPRLGAHEDEHERELKFAGNIGDVRYYIASCKCGWKSNIRSETAAKNAWQRHSDSLNERLRRQLAGPAPDTFRIESSGWKSVIDNSSTDMIGYGNGKQAGAQDAQGARPRQGSSQAQGLPRNDKRRSVSKRRFAHASFAQGSVVPKVAHDAEPIENAIEIARNLPDGAGWDEVHDVMPWPTPAACTFANERILQNARGTGVHGVFAPDLLDAALHRPLQELRYGADYDIFDVAASLTHALVSYHPFENGNHRTTHWTLNQFLEMNGYPHLTSFRQAKDIYDIAPNRIKFNLEEPHPAFRDAPHPDWDKDEGGIDFELAQYIQGLTLHGQERGSQPRSQQDLAHLLRTRHQEHLRQEHGAV